MEDKKAELSQTDKFRDLARELECDEDEDAFKEAVRKIGKAPPQQREKPNGSSK